MVRTQDKAAAVESTAVTPQETESGVSPIRRVSTNTAHLCNEVMSPA